MSKKLSIILFFNIIFSLSCFSKEHDFKNWLKDFKIKAVREGVSGKVVDEIMSDAKFLPKVIEYDRYQPEFYEDTKTYIKKRTSKKKVKEGLKLYMKEKKIIDEIEKNFKVEKELLLALMGIETNFGKYLGKMDIVSSLATLSYDKRRSEFFSNELITILKLIDENKISKDILFGSWAGAFGNFQFMPSTISKYAIDFNKNSVIELKEPEDSFASAANYLNIIGWKKNEPCFLNIELDSSIPKKFLNTSAKKIKYKKKFRYYKKFIKEFDNLDVNDDIKVAIITPDSDIVKDNDKLKPAFLVFSNYERVLTWNRSLRFAIAVCTLKDKFENEL